MRAPGDTGGERGAEPQAARDARPLVAFDFDGTLTARDSFVAFLRWRASGTGWALGLLRLAPHALLYVVSRDRARLKAASVRVFLKGVTRDQLARDAHTFAAARYQRLMRPDALAAWETHRHAGRRLAIVTASPEEIIAPFARRLGADALIGSRLAWTADGRVGGGLEGPNCRGQAKVDRLRERFGEDVALEAAYGDTSGDREMLAFAARGSLRAFRARPEGGVSGAAGSPSRRTRSSRG